MKRVFDIRIKMGRKHTNKLLKWEETMITRQAIYWIMSNFLTLNSDLRQQINLIGRLTRNEGKPMFFIIEKLEKTTFEFSQNAATVV